MKKNKAMRIASLLLILTIVSLCAISGTFAKYTSSASGSDTATVAKWSFTAMGSEIAVSGTAPTLSFNLFDTIKDTDGSTAEADVKSGLIAPGTSGSFDLKVKNNAEVTAKYTVSFTEKNDSSVPLQYSLDGTTWKDAISDLTTTGLSDQSLAVGAAEVTHTIYWRWVYEGTTTGAHASQTDATDTALGLAATAPTVEITATVTATQAD